MINRNKSYFYFLILLKLSVYYAITVTLNSGEYDGSVDSHFVTITGTESQTEENECDANFEEPGSTLSCTVSSDVMIGEFRCMKWRNVGVDGSRIQEVFDYLLRGDGGISETSFRDNRKGPSTRVRLSFHNK